MSASAAATERPEAASASRGRGYRHRFCVAAAVLALWFAFLLYLVLTSANPVVLSRPQMLAAPIVVEGRFLVSPARVAVERVWRGERSLEGAVLEIEGPLGTPPPTPESSYIVPLRRRGEGRWRIVPPPVEPDFPPAMPMRGFYPATGAVRRQLQALLDHPVDEQRP